MTFVSYAQNLEDVMLGRVFKGLPNGFYIDVGAHDPIIDSVTKIFYEQGWRGINIEPLAEYYHRLVNDRPEDINLNVAVSNQIGVAEFFDIGGCGLSTLSSEVAQQHLREGHQHKIVRVQTITLSQICRDCCKGEIHFLKIDVEGAEEQVLSSMDFKRYRPWTVVVEATYPNSQTPTYETWEPLLTEMNYIYVYHDGLNRYYLAAEHENLKAHFAVPPNVFDQYAKYWHIKMEQDNVRMIQQEKKYKEQIALAEHALAEKNNIILKKDNEIAALQKVNMKLYQKNEKLYQQLQSKEMERIVIQRELELNQESELTDRVHDLQSRLASIKQDKLFFEQAYKNVIQSKSWQVTAPLRKWMAIIKKFKNRQIKMPISITQSQPQTFPKEAVALSANKDLSIDGQVKTIIEKAHHVIKKTLVKEVVDV